MTGKRLARRSLAAVWTLALLGLLVEAGLVATFFGTAPSERPNPRGEIATATSGAVTFIALADVHARPGVLLEAVEDARRLDAAAVLIGGDLADRNDELHFRWGAALLDDGPAPPVFVAIGNHEGYARRGELSRERYEKFHGPTVSWFRARGVLVVSLDTADEEFFPEEQAARVDAILAAERPRSRGAVLLTHVMPLFQKPLIDKRGYVKHLHEPDSERVRALAAKHRVGLVLGGHFHGYATETRGDTVYVISGGGGGSLDGTAQRHHYLRVVFDGAAFTHEVVPVDSKHNADWIRFVCLRNVRRIVTALGGALVASSLLLLATRRWRDA